MDENQAAGTAKNMAGKLEEHVGRAIGDVKTEVEGKIDQVVGSAQDLYGQARETAEQAVDAVHSKAREAAAAVHEQTASFEQPVAEERRRTSADDRCGGAWSRLDAWSDAPQLSSALWRATMATRAG